MPPTSLRKKGKYLLIEALNPQTKPQYLYSSQYQTLDMIKLIDRPNVFTQLDLFHAQKVGWQFKSVNY